MEREPDEGEGGQRGGERTEVEDSGSHDDSHALVPGLGRGPRPAGLCTPSPSRSPCSPGRGRWPRRDALAPLLAMAAGLAAGFANSGWTWKPQLGVPAERRLARQTRPPLVRRPSCWGASWRASPRCSARCRRAWSRRRSGPGLSGLAALAVLARSGPALRRARKRTGWCLRMSSTAPSEGRCSRAEMDNDAHLLTLGPAATSRSPPSWRCRCRSLHSSPPLRSRPVHGAGAVERLERRRRVDACGRPPVCAPAGLHLALPHRATLKAWS